MTLLGDKNAARKLARENKVPVVPGSDGLIAGEAEAVRIAHEIGFPVLIIATDWLLGPSRQIVLAGDSGDMRRAIYDLAQGNSPGHA